MITYLTKVMSVIPLMPIVETLWYNHPRQSGDSLQDNPNNSQIL